MCSCITKCVEIVGEQVRTRPDVDGCIVAVAFWLNADQFFLLVIETNRYQNKRTKGGEKVRGTTTTLFFKPSNCFIWQNIHYVQHNVMK